MATDPASHPPSALTLDDARHLDLLRARRRAHRASRSPKPAPPAEVAPPQPLTRSQQLADRVAGTVGSWRFILLQSSAIALWMLGNALSGSTAWDPYPFILLNLLLSFQAAYTAPAIMMSQNRQSELDRQRAASDYDINVKAELEIELLHEKIDLLKERELLALTEAVRDLSARLQVLDTRLR